MSLWSSSVRKSAPEIQYLEGKHLTNNSAGNLASWLRPLGESDRKRVNSFPHGGIRFPQNGCLSCSHLRNLLGRSAA